jgi:hypothetical protein
MTSDEHICENCGNTFTASFCNVCGQKEAHRITISHVAHDLFHVFFHADKGVFTFMSRVLFYPGKIANEFIKGKRKIFNPYQYLIFAVGLLVFLMAQSHFYESLDSYNTDTTSGLPPSVRESMQGFSAFMKKQANLISFFSIPLYALFSWLFFIKRGQNYAEHFTITVFAMCQTYTLNALLLLGMIIFNVSSATAVTFSFLLYLLSFSLTYRQFYKLRWLIAIWKGFLVYVAGYIGHVLILMVGLVIYLFVLKR